MLPQWPLPEQGSIFISDEVISDERGRAIAVRRSDGTVWQLRGQVTQEGN